MKVQAPQAKHERLYQEVLDVFKKHGTDKSPEELLAIAANIVGKLIALQDQRVMTPARAMAIVKSNIEQGSREIALAMNPQGHA